MVMQARPHSAASLASTSGRRRRREKLSTSRFMIGARLSPNGTTVRPKVALVTIPKLPYINLQFADSATQGVAVHSQLAGGAALVALVFLENSQDEPFFEFPHALRVKNVAAVHLQNECFQLIFHDARLFLSGLFNAPLPVSAGKLRLPPQILGSLMNESQALIEPSAQF